MGKPNSHSVNQQFLERTLISQGVCQFLPLTYMQLRTLALSEYLFLFGSNERKQLSHRCCLQNSESELCLNSAAVFPVAKSSHSRSSCSDTHSAAAPLLIIIIIIIISDRVEEGTGSFLGSRYTLILPH